MSLLSINYPLIIEPYRHCKNGLYPDADFYSQCHAALNHIQVYRGAEVFRRSNVLGNLQTGEDPGTIWRFRFRSGYAQTQLQFVGILGLAYDWRGSSPNTNTDDPRITLSVTKSGGATQTQDVRGGRSATTATDAPSEWIPFAHTFDIDPASVYECSIASTDYCRIISLSARTLGDPAIDDATNYLSEHEPAGTHPIYGANIQRLIEGSGNLLRQNRGLGINWCLYDGSARTRTSATAVNLIDNSSTGNPTSTTPGYRFVTTALATASRSTTVNIETAVYASMGGAGAAGYVRLVDTSGTAAVDLEIGSGAAAWYTQDADTIAVGTGQKYDLQFLSDGVNTLSVYAVCIRAWES